MTTTHTNPDHKGTEFFASLEGMRGIAAIGVVLYHVFWGWHLRYNSLIHHGALFVDFFFIISGFVICHIYATRLRDSGDLGKFLLLRTMRLYPLHLFTLVVIAVILVMTQWLGSQWQVFSYIDNDSRLQGTLQDFLLNLTLLHGILQHDDFTFNRPSWSISTEYYTYFLFALTALVTAARRYLMITIALAIVGIAGMHLWQRGGLIVVNNDDAWLVSPGMLRCVTGFFIGVLLQFIWQVIHIRAREAMDNWRSHLVEAASIAFVIFSMCRFNKDRMQFITLLSFAVLVLVFSLSRGWATKILESGVFHKLGQWSYSIYLTHFVILIIFAGILKMTFHKPNLHHVMSAWKMDIVTVIFVGTVLLVSSLTYRFIEIPPRAWAKSRIMRKRAAAAQSSIIA
ncbi:MAG TPA: acyltransferase [Gammaproteobacteria bacterium]